MRLYEEGLIYRGKRLVNWDPVLLTAVSDLEVESEEEDGSLWQITYPFAGGPIGGLRGLTVATTRPETMLGDVAVAVQPGRRALQAPDRQARRAARSPTADPDHRATRYSSTRSSAPAR